jgi:hypothetical protein
MDPIQYILGAAAAAGVGDRKQRKYGVEEQTLLLMTS